ncbi:hypothetical protein PpBr36_00447 [Pyricularia pennisetigena]|uniref:hypothetical protein n=1 Tax=Pyricularia pennisetigena TaxID=1578925 RepID=UPI00114EA2CC|nr:hypothetical protein PpBr36_00447 [Pyricularia pennisetigena]TLS28663.1 hypothetical protein PpBr36_00447 [Pyricularia pennisetigena]
MEDCLKEVYERRRELTEALESSPYDLILYLQRALVHLDLGYPDLASGDAYRALLLTDEVANDEFEYHESALECLLKYEGRPLNELLHTGIPAATVVGGSTSVTPNKGDECNLRAEASVKCLQILSSSLLRCGCLKSAYNFCQRGLAAKADDEKLAATLERINAAARQRLGRETVGVDDMPDAGLARREVYAWNTHEPDRFSQASLDYLNGQLAAMAPKCVVKASELPVLAAGVAEQGTCKQLGVFAAADIGPGEVVLREFSALTANNRLQEPVCDACGEELPLLSSASGGEGGQQAVNCEECNDTVFCSQECHDQAMELYHPAVCDKGVDSIAKDPEAADIDYSLYLLLLARLLAMAEHQDIHPLDVREVKYIWGDFVPRGSDGGGENDAEWATGTLPFSFRFNVETPLHVLETMDVDIYRTLARHDTWVMNTLYAKFRGTASARKSTRDGRPDVAAVHPFWCLANHDCDPNVTWEWSGRMVLRAKEERVEWGGERRAAGIKAGDEILNHYCDVNLSVRQRREWAEGSLGGWCMCQRCRHEAAAAEKAE